MNKAATKKAINTEADVTAILEKALNGLKQNLGEKKFAKRIKKAAKLLTEGSKIKKKAAVNSTGKETKQKIESTEEVKKSAASPAKKAAKPSPGKKA